MGRHALDLTGQWFGRLEVLRRVNIDGADRAAWLCRCRCNIQTIVLTHNLRAGRTTSCGCALADANKARASKPIRQVGQIKLVAERKPKPKGVLRNITHLGRTQGLQEWARELEISYQTIQFRLSNGWSVKRALTTPVRKWVKQL